MQVEPYPAGQECFQGRTARNASTCSSNTGSFLRFTSVRHESSGRPQCLQSQETLKGIGTNFPVSSAAQLNAQFAKDPKLKGQSPSWIWINKQGKGHVFNYFRKTFKLAKVPKSVQLFISCDNEAEIWINGDQLQGNKDWREPTVINITGRLKKGRQPDRHQGQGLGVRSWACCLVCLHAFFRWQPPRHRQ